MNINKALGIFVLFVLLLVSCKKVERQSSDISSDDSTFDIEALANGYEYVDLGICNGLKWATANVGSQNPEDAGNYYSWGDIAFSQPPHYGDTHYKFSVGRDMIFNKYVDDNKYRDYKYALELEDDAAHVVMGGGWRIPREAEIDSLMQLCIWKKDTVNGIAGYRVFGKREGFAENSIFLPYTGVYDMASLKNASTAGYYWSSSVLVGGTTSAIGLILNEEFYTKTFYFRYYGQAVRAVFMPGEKLVERINLSHGSLTMQISDQPMSISAEVLPTTATSRNIYWSSTDSNVAVVNSTGTITPRSRGVCDIVASVSDNSNVIAKCALTVVDAFSLGHDYLDMLTEDGLKWATTNYGAESPEDPGVLLTWEEAQNINWGEGWRLPTSEELESLIGCYWMLSERNGNYGYEVFPHKFRNPDHTHRQNLFFPLTDCDGNPIRDKKYLSEDIIYGQYWSGTTFPSYKDAAIGLSLDMNGAYWNYNLKSKKCFVRPVVNISTNSQE